MKITYIKNSPIFHPANKEEEFILNICLLANNMTAFRLGVGLEHFHQEELKKEEERLKNQLDSAINSYKKL